MQCTNTVQSDCCNAMYQYCTPSPLGSTSSWIQMQASSPLPVEMTPQMLTNLTPLLLQQYYNLTPLLLQQYYNLTPLLLQQYYNLTLLLLQQYYNLTPLLLQQFYNLTPLLLQQFYNLTPLLLQQFYILTPLLLQQFYNLTPTPTAAVLQPNPTPTAAVQPADSSSRSWGRVSVSPHGYKGDFSPVVIKGAIEDIFKGDILCKTHFFVAFICIFAYPECLPTP